MADSPDKKKGLSSLNTKELLDSLRVSVKKIEPHLGFIYTVILLAGVTLTVYFVSQSLQMPATALTSDSTTSANSFSIRFDDATIKKIQTLNDYENQSFNVAIPDGRINPFAE